MDLNINKVLHFDEVGAEGVSLEDKEASYPKFTEDIIQISGNEVMKQIDSKCKFQGEVFKNDNFQEYNINFTVPKDSKLNIVVTNIT